MTRLASVTATGVVCARPAAAAAATAGQSMHQTASTRDEPLEDTHPPTARTEPNERPLARMANRTRLIRPHPGVGAPSPAPVTS